MPHSEIVTVKDQYGNTKTSTNPQAGAMSGADPVGEFVVGIAAGHLVQEGISNGKKVYRAQDIWKFNPDEYKQKWSSHDLDSKAVLGLRNSSNSKNTMAVQVITNNDSIYDYWYEDGQLYGRRKSNKVPFKINSDKANSIIFPQVQAKGVDPTKPTSTLVYHPAKYKEMPTAKKISIPKQEEETIWERGKQLINLVGNGLSRKLQLFFDSEPEHTSKRIKISNKKVTKNKRRENLEQKYLQIVIL